MAARAGDTVAYKNEKYAHHIVRAKVQPVEQLLARPSGARFVPKLRGAQERAFVVSEMNHRGNPFAVAGAAHEQQPRQMRELNNGRRSC